MEQENCICSVLSLLNGECAQETAVYLTKTLWDKGKRRVLYIPAGMQFEAVGTVSMTDLYFSYRKKLELPLPFGERKPILVKPFHCFLEGAEIREEQYNNFVQYLAQEADCLVASLDGVSPERLHWFLENSSLIAVLVTCKKGGLSPQLSGFLHNLKLLWGEELGDKLKRFLFIVPGGNQEEKELLQRQLRQDAIWLQQEEENIVFVTEEDFSRQKNIFWKKSKENWRKPV